MNLPSPKTAKDYPIYTIGYWLVAWAVVFLYAVITIMSSVTPSGRYVEKRDCLETDSSGRYDEQTECIEYPDSYYVPVGNELGDRFKSSGITTGILALLIGGFGMYGKYKKEQEENLRKIKK